MTEARVAGIIFLAAIFGSTLMWSGEANAASEGEMCGGFAGIKCDNGLWCEPEPGKCGVADVGGTCVTVPTLCPKDFNPVCGCGNLPFGNDCERRATKVAKASDGACDPKKCPEVVDKVCATKDGKRATYANDCFARVDGATEITKGACEDAK